MNALKLHPSNHGAGCLCSVLSIMWFGGAAGSLASAETVSMVAYFNGHQSSADSPGFGCGRFVIDTAANTLDYHIAFGSLIGVEAISHIHGPGAPGVVGPVMAFLPLGNPKVGTWNYPEAAEGTLLSGLAYVAIHSSEFPQDSGEIRGQIVDMVAVLNGVQENPPSGSNGRGYGLFNIDRCANELSYYIVIEALDGLETNAHIHGYGLHTEGGNIVHALPGGPIKIGTWNYPQEHERRILNGQTHVNIHSEVVLAGEIRGQIVRTVAPLDADQEVPPSGAQGHGCGLFALDPTDDTLSYYLAYGGLSGPPTAAHIHGYAPAGMNAGPQHTIATDNPVVGEWVYPAGDETSLLDGLTYVNVHTSANVNGEIRGQVLFPEPLCLPDLNCDGAVNAADLALLLGAWGPNPDHPADFNDDGAVNAADLALLLGGWGACP